MLAEKGCSFDLDDENIPFKRLSNAPTEDPPVLLDDGHYIFDYEVITEYLEEKYPEIKLLGNDLYERAEIRR